MSDRELLELAAKAAAIILIDWHDNWAEFGPGYRYEDTDGMRQAWNPLNDDGDAFRLAVKLGLSINIMLRDEEGYASASVWGTGQCRENAKQGDLRGATRIAIVKMAAKIGRSIR